MIRNFSDYDYYTVEQVKNSFDSTVRVNFSSPMAVKVKIYPVSTEMGPDFMSGFDFTDMRILTVGSSGDQIFEYALRGSRDITVMDANFKTLYFCELKAAALKALSREEYCTFFASTGDDFMKKEMYAKVRSYITNDQVVVLWDYIFLRDEWYINNLFHYNRNGSYLPTYFATDENYYSVRQIIDNVSVKFYCADISDFYKYAEGEYYLIDLSNILRYHIGNEKLERYWNAVTGLHRFLSVDGILKLEYGGPDKPVFDFLGKPAERLLSLGGKACFIVWHNDSERYVSKQGAFSNN